LLHRQGYVHLRAWRYDARGQVNYVVPVYLLDSDLPENDVRDRTLTHWLYGGEARYRLCQEAILGLGGVRVLRAWGYDQLGRFHMNEGHASLLTMPPTRQCLLCAAFLQQTQHRIQDEQARDHDRLDVLAQEELEDNGGFQ
jgi:glucan phosphorylase